MKKQYRLIHNFIENRELHLQVEFPWEEQEEKPRVIAVFQDGKQDRRIPLMVDWNKGEQIITASGKIQLSYVFWKPVQRPQVTVTLEAQRGTNQIPLEGESLIYPAKEFPVIEKMEPMGKTIARFLLFCLTIPLLPCFLLHGLFAYIGLFPLDTGENTAKGKKAIVIHANVITKRISGFSYSIREWKTNLFRLFYQGYCKQPVEKGMILLLSERKMESGGNLDCVRAQLKAHIEQGILTDVALVEEYTAATIDRLSVSAIRECARKIALAQVIVLEDFYPQLHQLQLRQDTTVIQLWHACGSFKTFGFSRLGKPGGALQASPNHRNYDYAMVSGAKMVDIYSEAFGIPTSHVKALGVPRTDIFFQKEYEATIRARLYKNYPQLAGKKVILFAPTFRGDGNKDAYYPMDRFTPKCWVEELPENFMVIIKHHPFVKQSTLIEEQWNDRILELSEKENINDLLFVTDYLVTDYSSVVFEAALRDIPMVFYGFDWKEYMETRDMYGDYKSFIPGPLVETEEELFAFFREPQKENYLEYFRQKYMDVLDGHSTKRVVALIENCVKGEIR
jgi:CDP-glycerol glycerophosphotransferase (TagB/SpsB family)